MSELTIVTVDAITGSVDVEPFSEIEETIYRKHLAYLASIENKKTDAKKAVLDKLGLTADEAATLLG